VCRCLASFFSSFLSEVMFINPPIIFGVNLTPTSVNIYLFIFCFRFNDFSEFNGDNSVNIKLTC